MDSDSSGDDIMLLYCYHRMMKRRRRRQERAARIKARYLVIPSTSHSSTPSPCSSLLRVCTPDESRRVKRAKLQNTKESAMERRMMQYMDEKTENKAAPRSADELFFLSISQYLKNVSESGKIRFRQVVFNELFKIMEEEAKNN